MYAVVLVFTYTRAESACSSCAPHTLIVLASAPVFLIVAVIEFEVAPDVSVTLKRCQSLVSVQAKVVAVSPLLPVSSSCAVVDVPDASHTLKVYCVAAEAVALCATLPFAALLVKRHAVLDSPFGAIWSFVGVTVVAVQSLT